MGRRERAETEDTIAVNSSLSCHFSEAGGQAARGRDTHGVRQTQIHERFHLVLVIIGLAASSRTLSPLGTPGCAQASGPAEGSCLFPTVPFRGQQAPHPHRHTTLPLTELTAKSCAPDPAVKPLLPEDIFRSRIEFWGTRTGIKPSGRQDLS